jgi:serine/threonine protein kinase
MLIRGKYSISSEIGQGKFGIVYKGKNERTGISVALKFEHTGGSLRHEASILSYLLRRDVKGIPIVFWFGPIEPRNPTLCMVTSFFDLSLKEHMCRVSDRLTGISSVVRGLLNILKCIHSDLVIHRDIKPDNVRIHDGEPYLIDFGLAAVFVDDEGIHKPEQFHHIPTGSRAYMSPAVHLGASPSRRDDLVSLGYIFLWGADGRLPWEGSGGSVGVGRDVELAAAKALDALCSGFGERRDGIVDYLGECYALAYEEAPNYARLAECIG